MGCSGLETDLEDNDDEKNLLIKIYKGELTKNSLFTDTIIKSDNELEDKLRSFIALKVKKENSEELTYNINDEIWTKSNKFDFKRQYIIALNGINNINNVQKSDDNNYIIYHDNQPSASDEYIAIVVKKIRGKPSFILASPKKPFLKFLNYIYKYIYILK